MSSLRDEDTQIQVRTGLEVVPIALRHLRAVSKLVCSLKTPEGLLKGLIQSLSSED